MVLVDVLEQRFCFLWKNINMVLVDVLEQRFCFLWKNINMVLVDVLEQRFCLYVAATTHQLRLHII